MRIGALAHEYGESYYFGNPGMYQHFVLSNNELGTGSFGYSIQQEDGPTFTSSGFLAAEYEVPVEHRDQFDDEAAYARKFRAETTINTLTVLGCGANPDLRLLAEPRGPDPLRARMLLPSHRELRQIRRRIRRMNAELAGNTKRRYLRVSRASSGAAGRTAGGG